MISPAPSTGDNGKGVTAGPSSPDVTPAPFVDVCPVCGLVMRPYEPRFRADRTQAWRHLSCAADPFRAAGEQHQTERDES